MATPNFGLSQPTVGQSPWTDDFNDNMGTIDSQMKANADSAAPGAGKDTTAIHNNVAGEIAAISAKATAIGADKLLIEDSADTNNKKSVAISAIVKAIFPTPTAVSTMLRADGVGGNYVEDTNIRSFGNGVFEVGKTGTPGKINVFDNAGVVSFLLDTSAPTRLVIKGSTVDNTSSGLNVTDSADNSLLFVRSDGRVGISVDAPERSLHVAGNGILLNNNVPLSGKQSGGGVSPLAKVSPFNEGVFGLNGEVVTGGATVFFKVSSQVIFDVSSVTRANVSDQGLSIGNGATKSTSQLSIKGTTTDNTASGLNVTDSADASLLFVRNDGNVGIGTVLPERTLHVAGDGILLNNNVSLSGKQAGGGISQLVKLNSGGEGVFGTNEEIKTAGGVTTFRAIGAGALLYNVNSVTRVNISTSGMAIGNGVTFSTSQLLVRGATNDNTASALNVIDLGSNSLLFVRNDGKIGINTTTPATLFDIKAAAAGADTVRVSNTIGNRVVTFGTISNDHGGLRIFQSDGTTEDIRMTADGGASWVLSRLGIGTDTPATSALLDLTSTTGSLLVSRMTTTQRDALTAVNGMVLYNTTTGAFNFREGGAWVTK